ncbi:alpha/beta fold hydrolase [Cupriavidus sp. IDO]|uniref:alpha/beta fold hydrolase n=1 Tax=Cupriavidus sp. IDO TaxID=1539142 RepID=UPI0009E22B37|nr:alpha/beta fold hydrolase [Cupriavidus sp. IDO]
MFTGRASCLVLHGGASTSERSHWSVLRQNLSSRGIGSVAVDFSRHGESSARTANSLSKRDREALAALQYLDEAEPRAVVGISMSGEIAVRLAADPRDRIARLITVVGAAYDSEALAWRHARSDVVLPDVETEWLEFRSQPKIQIPR